MREIIEEVNDFLSASVDPIQERFLFQGRPSKATLNDTPMILMLGNHSSGKSSFINHFIGEDVQLTGMAPTDEDFTILRYGPTEKERPGSSLVSNPELGYEGLNKFGPRFLSHLKTRIRPSERLKAVSLVDTPGMIDSADTQAHRGFDFQGAVRWFAERADLIMLFFDPERPGTTAETLQIYTESLRDFDHKLLVVMNKVDQFRKLSDFARCYGTLCWNLGKVMRTKDLPLIYVTYLPVEGAPRSSLPMEEFDISRRQLLRKMEQTSLQRADNILTDVAVYLDRLLIHTQVLSGARRWYKGVKRASYLGVSVVLGALSAWIYLRSDLAGEERHVATAVATVTLMVITSLIVSLIAKRKEAWYQKQPEQVFEQLIKDLRVSGEREEHLRAHWRLISDHTLKALTKLGLRSLPKLKKKESRAIAQWVTGRLPALRGRVHHAEDEAGVAQMTSNHSGAPLELADSHEPPVPPMPPAPPTPPAHESTDEPERV